MKTRKICNFLKWLCTALVALMLAMTCFGCADRDGGPDSSLGGENNSSSGGGSFEDEIPPPLWASNFGLPDADGALSRLGEIYGGADKVFLLQSGKIARMPCPQGEVITVNVALEVGEYAKLVLEDAVAEFNEVFATVNPNYAFAINYLPTEEDFAKKYSVRLAASDNLSSTDTSQVFGVAHVSYYNNFTELGDFGITIKSEVFDNGKYLMMTFRHELMHLLGAGDAYKNASATKATVMQSYKSEGYHHLSATDVAFLDALYRNPEFADEDERILSYIDGYEESPSHTVAKLTSATFNKLVANLDAETVLLEAREIGYKDLGDFSLAIGDGIKPDPTFGSKSISFKELKYAVEQEETYFGSIEPQSGRYYHGRQTGSMGSSTGVVYTDNGNGILSAAPGGKSTMLIKTGEFVLTFRISGGFSDFAGLALTVWHVSK